MYADRLTAWLAIVSMYLHKLADKSRIYGSDQVDIILSVLVHKQSKAKNNPYTIILSLPVFMFIHVHVYRAKSSGDQQIYQNEHAREQYQIYYF